ncbi:hypothetical protein I6A84_08010, partial [Frankia sp. CNm7]|nr:hypothetical protein [Frankia nepalensis]
PATPAGDVAAPAEDGMAARVSPPASARPARTAGPAHPVAGGGIPGRPRVSAGRGGRMASPEYAPVRLSDERAIPLTEEELAAARAETVELGGYAAARPADGPVPDAHPTATAYQASASSADAYPPVAAPSSTHRPQASAHPTPDENYTNNVRVTGTRQSSGRPSARPPTSRPGRVQINPPGTHGGLTAPPSVSAPSVSAPSASVPSVPAPAASGAGVPDPAPGDGQPVGAEEAGGEVRMLRPAVGG